MTVKNNFMEGVALEYVTPSMIVLDYQNEGLLCMSSGTPDRADNGYGDNVMDEI